MSLTLELNCLVLGDGPTHIFGVEIEDNKKVSDLKEFLKDKNKPAFDQVPAHALEVYKVSFPVDNGLDTKLKHFQPEHNGDHRLSNAVEHLKGVFGDPVDGNLHVIVLPPPAGE
jgi:hypothetical protein